MNHFLKTMKEQFESDINVSCISDEDTLQLFLNKETEILMYVYKDELSNILSIEFVGV